VNVPKPNAGGFRTGPLPAQGGGRLGRGPGRKPSAGRAAALAAVLLMLVGGAVALLLWRPWAGRPNLQEEDIKFLPDGCQAVAVVRVRALLESPLYPKLTKKYEELTNESFRAVEAQVKKAVGLALAEIDTLTVGGRFQDGDSEVALVVRTTRPVRPEDILDRIQFGNSFVKTKVGAYRLYEYDAGEQLGLKKTQTPSFVVVNDTTIVAGPAASVRKALERDAPPVFSSGLKAAMEQTDFSRTFALAATKVPRDLRDLLKTLPVPNIGKAVGSLNFLEGVGLEIQLGSRCDVKGTALFADEKLARDVYKTINSALQTVQSFHLVPEEWSPVLKSIKVKVSGTTLTGTLTMEADTLLNLIPGDRGRRGHP
jgi:hypothetical protein